MKWHAEGRCTFFPFAFLRKEAMSEFTERTMSDAKTSANPIRHLTDECRIRVVDPNEFGDVRAHP
jgi:hypothetical protein